LEVYREAYSLALEISRLTKSFPRFEQVELARQLRRAARSVPANIVEGWAKRASGPEFKRYLQVAIGSCDETRMWLEMSKDERYISGQKCEELRGRLNRTGAMLQGLWKQWRSRGQS
ncbi:four helix bundle protein, partial [Acidobacteriia bacterium AH_259_A11_L15]|nr:four helix bundle protein [Acidobacteriia bacterium AH_259_A11_L15]